MLLTRNRKRPLHNGQDQCSEQERRAVYVVFAVTAAKDTGAQQTKQIIGIFEGQDDAEELEQAFNEQMHKAENVIVKAFSMRYGLPYVIPMMKEMMGSVKR